jgi:TolB-like protein/DNA-binding winged helix-turn-helix (wHTH) protein
MSLPSDGVPDAGTAATHARRIGHRRPELLPKLFRIFRRTGRAPVPDGLLRIGRASVDLRTGEVRAPDGTTTILRPKTAAMLQVLSARAGELISKDELLEAVWPDTTIDEDGLVQCVSEARRALGDEGRMVLRTHAKRGYSLHLVGQAAAPATTRAATSHWRRLYAIALALVVAVTVGLAVREVTRVTNDAPAQVRGPVVAVFPFEALAGGTRWERLARALTQDIIADLAQNSWLRVLADATTRSAGPVSPETAGKLGAEYFVSGSIQAENGLVRVAASLIETQTGRQLWSKRIDAPVENFLGLQRSASIALVGELSSHWNGPIARAGRATARQRGIDNLDAYELYLMATEKVHSYTPEDLAEAAGMYRRVVAMAPEFGEAWAQLSLTIYNMVTPDMSASEMERMWQEGHAAAREAYRVSPDNPHAIAQAANAVRWDDPAEAERMVRRAAALAPNNADILAYLSFRATHYPALGPDAERWITRAIELNPNHPNWYHWNRGAVLMVVGRYAEAVEAFALAPEHIEVKADRIAALALAGDVAQARLLLSKLVAESPEFSISFHKYAAGFDDSVGAIFARGLRLAGAAE